MDPYKKKTRGRYGGVCHVAFGQVKENTQVGDAAVEMIRNGSFQKSLNKNKKNIGS